MNATPPSPPSEPPSSAAARAPRARARAWPRRAARVVFALAALGALVWMLDHIGWDEVGASFRRVGWLGALALLVGGLGESWFDAAALRAAIPEGRRLTTLRTMAYHSAGSVVNLFVPWDAGEVFKTTLLRRHVSYPAAISGIVLWNTFFKFTRPAVALGAALLGWWGSAQVSGAVALTVAGAALAAFLPFVVLRIAIRSGMAVRVVTLLRAVGVVKGEATRLREGAAELDYALAAFRADRPRDLAAVIAFQVLARLASWTSYWIAAYFLGLGYGFALMGTVYAALSVSGYVAMLVPARVGVTEGVAFVTFELLGLPGEAGLLIALLIRLRGLVVNSAGAVYAAATR